MIDEVIKMIKLETYSAFQAIINDPFFVLVAKTEGCSVCKPVAMRIEQMMTAFPQVPLYQLDVEKVEEFRGQHLVFTVPTVLVFEQGREILRESRFVDFQKIQRLLSLYTS
jgi:hypothetical protein